MPNLANNAVRPSLRVVGLVLGLLIAAPALAQGTAEQRSACMGDAMRLCSAHIPDADKIADCLTGRRAEVSSACRIAMKPGSATVEVASTGSVRGRTAP